MILIFNKGINRYNYKRTQIFKNKIKQKLNKKKNKKMK